MLEFQQKKYHQLNNRFLKHFFSTSFIKLFSITLAFIQGIIIARYLLPEGRGIIAIYLAVINMLLPLSELGIKQSSSYFLSKMKYEINKIVNTQTITLIISSILTIILLSLIYSFKELDNFFILLLIFLSIPLRIYISFTTAYGLSNREINKINIVQLILVISDFIFVVLFFILLNLSVEYYFVSYFLSSLFASIYTFFWLKNSYKITLKINFKEYKEESFIILRKGITYALPLFVIGLNYSADLLILDFYVSKDSLGIYAVGVTLAILIWQLPTILSLLVFSYSVSSNNEKNFSLNLWNKSKLLMLALIPITLVLTFLLKYLIPLLYGELFTRSFDVVLYLMPGVYFMIAFKLLNGDLAARGYPQIAFYIFSFGAILNIILNIYLIPIFNIEGAAIASSISYIFCSIIFTIKYYTLTFKV
jgi:O-antigen/teichoic acid export membrane protein